MGDNLLNYVRSSRLSRFNWGDETLREELMADFVTYMSRMFIWLPETCYPVEERALLYYRCLILTLRNNIGMDRIQEAAVSLAEIDNASDNARAAVRDALRLLLSSHNA